MVDRGLQNADGSGVLCFISFMCPRQSTQEADGSFEWLKQRGDTQVMMIVTSFESLAFTGRCWKFVTLSRSVAHPFDSFRAVPDSLLKVFAVYLEDHRWRP